MRDYDARRCAASAARRIPERHSGGVRDEVGLPPWNTHKPSLTEYWLTARHSSIRRVEATIKEQDPELANDIHMFSSFFYKKLTTRDRKSNIEPYDTVKKWTSKFDLFKKKYVFIPINEK